MTDKSYTAQRMIQRARTHLLKGRPEGRGAFFGQLAMRMELIADPDGRYLPPWGRTMGVDGRNLFFAPEWVEKRSADELLAVVAHEILHICLSHHTRRGNRNPQLFNMACDYAINLELKDCGFTLPEPCCCDERFRDMSAERIFTILESECVKVTITGKGDGEGWGVVLDMPGSGGDGKGDGDQDGKRNAPTQEEIEQERRHWQMAAAQAAAAARAQQQGNLPGFAERFLADLARPKVDPWEMLRELCSATRKSDYTWSRPNRRFISSGNYWPSVHSEDAMGRMVIVGDTSGSIDDTMLAEFGRHMNAIKEDYRPEELIVIWCDAGVANVERFGPDDDLVLTPKGGGGTDFRPPFEWVENNMEEPPVVFVYFTDLQGSFPAKQPEYPVIWCTIIPGTAPFGTTIEVTV